MIDAAMSCLRLDGACLRSRQGSRCGEGHSCVAIVRVTKSLRSRKAGQRPCPRPMVSLIRRVPPEYIAHSSPQSTDGHGKAAWVSESSASCIGTMCRPAQPECTLCSGLAPLWSKPVDLTSVTSHSLQMRLAMSRQNKRRLHRVVLGSLRVLDTLS